MNNVKKCIASLCCHLNFLFNFDLTTEDFRLAKLNGTEGNIVSKFWKLLNALTFNDGAVNSKRILDFLKSINFKNPDLSDSLNQGSKNLLIAVGFVLSEGLETAIEEEIKRSPFDEKFDMLQEDIDPIPTPNFSTFTCERDFQRYTDWLRTRVLLNTREINEMQNQNLKILEKLKKSSLCMEGGSMNEILALNNEKYARKFMNQTDKITKILINHQDWIKNESVFWQWMVSVLHPTEKEKKITKTRRISYTNNKKKQVIIYCSNKYFLHRAITHYYEFQWYQQYHQLYS